MQSTASSVSPTARAESPAEIAPARFRDVPEIRAAYLAQSTTERQLYHPFPFGPGRFTLTLDLLILLQRASMTLARRFPRAAAMLYVARLPGEHRLAGFGTLRFRRCPDGVLASETGYFVLPEFRRRGVGRQLKWAMIESGRRHGTRRAQALILPNNLASLRLNEGLGFRVQNSKIRDRHPPYLEFMMSELELTDDPAPHAAPIDPTRSAEPA